MQRRAARALRPLTERFWAKVECGQPDACWNWRGSKNKGGYGHIGSGGAAGKTLDAHKVSWELANGPVPDGRHVLHTCDNRACVNPGHLWIGTHQDNMADMVAKGRHWAVNHRPAPKPLSPYTPSGETHAWAKLSDVQVREIHRLATEGISQQDLAGRFRVSRPQVSRILADKQRKAAVAA